MSPHAPHFVWSLDMPPPEPAALRPVRADLDALARAAVTYTLPLYEITRMLAASSVRKNKAGRIADPGAHASPESTWRWVNLFGHTRRLLGPADRRVVTPNKDTLYTNTWLDLSDGPLLIHTPFQPRYQ